MFKNKNIDTILPFELEPSWAQILEAELHKPYMETLIAFLENEYMQNQTIYPSKELIFNAFRKTPFNQVKVVIVGQDPYHGPGQAHGLCFSVPEGVAPPPSLKNIYKELVADLNVDPPPHGCLNSWAEQGVMLLNTTLTVREGNPLSHFGKGWELFTDTAIRSLGERNDSVIFVLWGNVAQEKCAQIMPLSEQHAVLKAAHPSPLSASRGFLGCRHFSKINEILKKNNKKIINWTIK